MTSVSERLAKYRAAAEETSRFGDLDATPPAREWDVPEQNAATSSIATKAQEYEKSVQILRADQDTPGLLEKFQSGDSVLDVEEQQIEQMPAVKSAEQTRAILQRTKEYEKSVKLLRADQEKPGIAEKLLQQNQSYTSDIDKIVLQPSLAKSSNKTNSESYESESQSESDSDSDEPQAVQQLESGDDSSFDGIQVNEEINDDSHQLTNKHSQQDLIELSGTTRHPSAPRLSDIATSVEYTVQTLSTGDPRLRGNNTQHSGRVSGEEKSTKTLSSSFHSSGSGFTGDEFDAISTESLDEHVVDQEFDEGAVQMEELVGGSEFTNDAVIVEEEESISVQKYYEAKRQGTLIPERAPTLASMPESRRISSYSTSPSSSSTSVSSEEYDLIRLPERGSDRPAPPDAPPSRRAVRRVPRADTGRPESTSTPSPPDSLLDEASEAEDEGVRLGWSRQHSDRLPKAKVVMIPRRRSIDGSTTRREDSIHDIDDEDMTAAPTTLPNRRLVKQYKDRADFMGGRVSRVEQTRASRLALEREERARRHAAGVARRSSLVAHTIDRVSMAADPFIEFMDNRGTPGPRKPRGALGKLWYKLFKSKKKRGKDMIKSG